ncbi:hypothetical protein ILYODFUR_038547, partial [Ilyodon furcidens]
SKQPETSSCVNILRLFISDSRHSSAGKGHGCAADGQKVEKWRCGFQPLNFTVDSRRTAYFSFVFIKLIRHGCVRFLSREDDIGGCCLHTLPNKQQQQHPC